MATEALVVLPETQAKLQKLAHTQGRRESEVLDAAVDAYYRQKLLEGMADDFAKLRSDPVAWAEELAERQAWDVTLSDGVEKDEND